MFSTQNNDVKLFSIEYYILLKKYPDKDTRYFLITFFQKQKNALFNNLLAEYLMNFKVIYSDNKKIKQNKIKFLYHAVCHAVYHA